MSAADADMGAFALGELAFLDLAGVVLEGQEEAARDDLDPLVLRLVVLEREALAGRDVEELADVAIRVGPDDLVAPRLLDPPRERARRWRRDRVGRIHRGRKRDPQLTRGRASRPRRPAHRAPRARSPRCTRARAAPCRRSG